MLARSPSAFDLLLSLSVLFSATVSGQGTAQTAKKVEPDQAPSAVDKDVTQGALRVVKKDGTVVECPLRHTDVRADVAGFVGRVRVTQTFANPSTEPIEAVYVFPLPHEAAVDEMTMSIGAKRIVGVIKKRMEARQIYQAALSAGQTAALLEQERPNIFTQSVGNIEPGQEVKIEISYVDVLRYDLGTYEFQFPMVVGPRYIPGNATSTPAETSKELRGKVSPPVANTDRVPDAERISPPVLRPGVRNGHDISLAISLDAGVPIQDLVAANHRAEVVRDGDRKAQINLSADDSLPNKDFVLRYRVSGKQPAMAVLAHTGKYSGDVKRAGEGYFMLMVQPQEDERLHKSPPREIVFLVDVSGSMSGAPTEKVRETMQHMLQLCREQDTVQVITFASHAEKLFEQPVPASKDNIARALTFTQGLKGGGGTQMLKGVKLAIDAPIDDKRLRIVVMLTDGYIGNEAEIIEHVGKHCGDQVRFWCVGIGQAPNMFLVDGVAKQGGGMGKQLGLNEDSSSMSQEIVQRIQRAQLAQVRIDWGNSRVSETFPARIPELWAGRPIIVFGRYAGGGEPTTVTVHGKIEGEPASWPLQVALPVAEPKNDALAKVWSRRKIEDLMQQAFYFDSPAVEEEVTALALDYRLMSQYTSFVAVDEKDANANSKANLAAPPRRMLVPVPLPDGTRWEGFFGNDRNDARDQDELAEGLRNPERKLALTDNFATLAKKVSQPAGRGRAFNARYYMESRTTAGGAPAGFRQKYKSMDLGRGRSGGGGFGRGGYGLVDKEKLATVEELARPDLSVAATVTLGENSESLPAATSVLQSQIQSQLETARAELKLGQESQGKSQWNDAAMALVRAYMLANSIDNAAGTDEGVGQQAIEALEAVRAEQIKTWNREIPSLEKRLDLVVRDKSVSEALEIVAKAAGIKIELLSGSEQDSSDLIGRPARVTYLDLRGATVAQACDWLLLPFRMTWQPAISGKSLVAGTCRRLPGQSPWVYDVSLIAWPTKEELATKNDQQRLEQTTQGAAKFAQVVRSLGRTAKLSHVSWFSPGELLVVATADQHAEVDRLLADLADPKAKLAKEAAELHSQTSKRAQVRIPERKKLQLAASSARIMSEILTSGWKLLSVARLGEADQESLTTLQIAWSSPEVAAMVTENQASLGLLRSAWVVNEASQLVPQNRELAELATLTRLKTQRLAAKAMSAVQDPKQANRTAIVQTAYAALVYRQDEKLANECVQAMQGLAATPEHGPAASLVLALLQPSSPKSETALVELVEKGVQGQDQVVLLNWACRQTGGKTPSAFRERSAEWLGNQPLPGEVVVLVNRP